MKKERFQWSEQAKESFQKVKEMLISTRVFVLPDFKKLFVVECDAFKIRIEAVISQEGSPVSF